MDDIEKLKRNNQEAMFKKLVGINEDKKEYTADDVQTNDQEV